MFKQGIYEGQFVKDWLGEKLAGLGVRTFADLRYEDPERPPDPEQAYRLVVMACDISHGCPRRLPWEYGDYGLAHADQLVVDAVRAWVSIPFFHRPARLTGADGRDCWLMDGAVLSRFPIGLFDVPSGLEPRWPTFGNRLGRRRLLFFAHIRAAIGSAVQQTNCHPFRYDQWLFMRNGFIDGFAALKRDLVLAVGESLFPEIKGTADTEVLFYLSLTFGLEADPPDAVARAIGFVEACGRARGVEYPFQGTIATTDGESLWVPLLEPGQVPVTVLHPRRPHAAPAVPGPGDLARGIRRRAAGGI